MDIKNLVKEYRDLRDELDSRRKEYMEFEKIRKSELYDLEQQMLDISNATGVDSFKTEYGTAFKTTKSYVRLAEGPDAKQARINYAMETNDFGLFTSHVNKTHAKELLDEGFDLSKAGIEWVEEYAFNFRKPTK